MKKKEYVGAIAEKSGYTQKDIKVVLKAIQEVVEENLGSEDGVPVIDGLKLFVVDKEARTGRNPKTGEAIMIPAKRTPKAKIGKILKGYCA